MVSIVIPIYNEEEIFHILHTRVSNAIRQTGEEYEIVYVNDGSRDRSLPIMLEAQKRDPHLVVVDLSRNWGHMGAVYAGLKAAKGDAVVLMDGDLQDPPEVIPQFVEKWRGGAQVVTAVRRSRQESRKGLGVLFAIWHKLFDKISDFKIPENSGVFGLCDRQAMDAINALTERNRYFPGLRAWVGYRNEIVYYDRADRAGGEGKLSFMSRIKYATDAIYTFSYKPLRLAMLLGGMTFLIATVLAVMAFVREGSWGAYIGLVAAVAFVGSLQMICLGVFAEYIARIYDEIRARPISLINRIYRAERTTGIQFEELPTTEEQLRAA
jgi:polyisoprenyl-phosphate glycosyltransferase